MNTFLCSLVPILNRLSRFSKKVMFWVIFALITCSVALRMMETDMEESVIASTAPLLVLMGVVAVICELASSMISIYCDPNRGNQ